MRTIIKRMITLFFSKLSFYKIKHGEKCKCNFRCHFTSNTEIGDNCHFNGMNISGSGKVIIGNNFHSGKNIRVLTTFHNFEHGTALPYDNTSYSKDVVIGDNVWLGESVMILGGWKLVKEQ